jgi:hypothetical protein
MNVMKKKTRAVRRFELRREAFKSLTEDYPGILRKVRRSMALDLSKRWYRAAQ